MKRIEDNENGSRRGSPAPPRLPKLCGADVELGNFVLGLDRPGGSGHEASRALLRQIEGLPRVETPSWSWQPGVYGTAGSAACGYAYDPQDWGRKFLPENGGCVYIDLDHLELCVPEVISAWDHVAAYKAMLRIARDAQAAANRLQPEGQRIQVLANNSDGQGNSYGSHLNFLVTRQAWDNLFRRKIHHLLYLASYQVSSIVFTGQGKVGSENGAPPVEFQLSQRADFFETLLGQQTTFRRPIVNCRDEALCGPEGFAPGGARSAERMARLHVIFFDNTLCETATLLKVGVMQIVLAMIEAGQINPNLIVDDPLEALRSFSHDPTLEAKARLASGQELTAVETQLWFLEEARRFADTGGCEGIVPRADEILDLWGDTLGKLRNGDFDALARRLDWVLKLSVMRRAMARKRQLSWESAQIRHLDHLYASLDPADGLYWTYERSGFVERATSEERIRWFLENPPEDTRAWTRAMLLRQAGADRLDGVDWDSIRFRTRGGGYNSRFRTLELSDPLGFTRAKSEAAFENAADLDAVLEAMDARPEESFGRRLQSWPDSAGYQPLLPI